MSRIKLYIRLCMIPILTLLCCLVAELPAQAVEKAPLKHVVLISVGGLSYEGFTSTATTNLNYLAGEGTIDRQALAVRTDTMESAETTLLTGAEASVHKHFTVNDSVEAESVFDILNKHSKRFLVVDGSGGKLQSFAHGQETYRKLKSTARSQEILAEAYSVFQKNKPFFTYIYIDDCAESLLRHDNKTYQHAIRELDTSLGVFLKKLHDSGTYKDTLIVVTSARSSSPTNQVPVIMVGPGVKVNTAINGSMIIDLASTICHLADLNAPANSRGIPIYSAFVAAEDQKQMMADAWIKALQKDRLDNWDMNYLMDDQLSRTVRQMTAIKEEKQSIFDFSGEREQLIAGLKSKIIVERIIWIAVVLLLILGFFIEYLWLKKRFLLFK